MTEAANPIADQYVAASRDAEAAFHSATDAEKYETVKPGAVVRRIVDEFMEVAAGDTGRVCPHAAGRGPHVIYGAACNPGWVGCQPCIHQLRDARLMVDAVEGEGRTCDGCKERARWGKSGVIQRGPILIEIALCESCSNLDEASSREDD